MTPSAPVLAPLFDPIAEGASIPAGMAVAAFSDATGSVRVLTGTALEAWVSALVTERFAAVQQDWLEAAATLAEGSVQRATAEQVAQWTRLLVAARDTGQELVAEAAGDELVRRNLWLPRSLAEALKATASARGLSQQDAFAEAARLWVSAARSTSVVS